MAKRLLLIVNTTEFFLSHRLPIALSAQKEGFEVHVATGSSDGSEKLEQYAIKHHVLPLNRSGKNFLTEAWTTFAIIRLIRSLKPDLAHLVTIKPVIYGGLATRLCSVPTVVAISGLGSVFLAERFTERLLRKFVIMLYRVAMGHERLRVIFQNTEDRKLITSICRLPEGKCLLIPGSGVNLTDYPHLNEPLTKRVKVLFAGRLLKDKGIREYVEAASLLSEQGLDADFFVAGNADPGNPATITEDCLTQWRLEGNVEFLGQRRDIPQLFSNAHIIVLPSYREGLPKVLIEAAACGRAVVTTDVPGCRDAIIPEQTGILVPSREVTLLANAIKILIDNPDLRRSMGIAGRKLAEEKFAIEYVIDAHMGVYRELIKLGGA